MRPFRLRRLLGFSELVFLVTVSSAMAVEWSFLEWRMQPKITPPTVAQTFNPEHRPVMTISGEKFLESELTRLVLRTHKFILLERSLLGKTLEELHDGAPGAGIGARIVLTETGRVVTEKEVAGELNAFADLDSLITKLIQ